jgi:DNA-binding response OmpR family regulator
MRILIVEDEAMIAFVIESALSAAGHQVVGPARDEPLALSLATTQKPGIALVDLRLARGSSGCEAAL